MKLDGPVDSTVVSVLIVDITRYYSELLYRKGFRRLVVVLAV